MKKIYLKVDIILFIINFKSVIYIWVLYDDVLIGLLDISKFFGIMEFLKLNDEMYVFLLIRVIFLMLS